MVRDGEKKDGERGRGEGWIEKEGGEERVVTDDTTTLDITLPAHNTPTVLVL